MDPNTTDNRLLIAATPMRQELLGGVSDMTLHRWLNDENLRFPRPIYIAKRRFWKTAEVLEWIEARGVAA
ncbi:helix-turn-helix transcriptional regulator [Paracoccus sanguinis]|uniref:Uncharacterized protein n=1 Tax=Paracoccus sanguinis TaxID=1545044 RepID=A0A099GKF1_9RHOB|nr:hypothetical protein [Paracoccus sanguinis]KGJ23221.1 hypothetical protein IX56_03460 [Paracoccus sanguinis]